MRKTLFAILMTCIVLAGCKVEGGLEFEVSSPYTNVSGSLLRSANTGGNTIAGEAVDIDLDGDIDLVLAMESVRNLILINDGTGALVDETDLRFPESEFDSQDVAAADFDRDGDVDLVFVSDEDQTNEYYLNDGESNFTLDSVSIPVGGLSTSVVSTDINNDGWPDLIIGNRGANKILINNKAGGFEDESSARYPAAGVITMAIELGDFDGDGDLDIFEANEGQNRVLINQGGVYTDGTGELLPELVDESWDVSLGDVDGDGDLDIFYANFDSSPTGTGNPQNRLLKYNGMTFDEATNLIPPSPLNSADATFLDMDTDGDLDILSGNENNGPIQIALINNESTGEFVDLTYSIFPSFNSFVADFVVADFNGDGEQDIYFCHFGSADGYLQRNVSSN